MLAALRDPEVTKFLLEYILDTPGGRRSVSRLSRTCKALSEPALNVLWRNLDSILPLLSLMPGHLFKKQRRPGLGFIKYPDARDWKRLLSYGERVRKIGYNETIGNVNADIFTAFEDTKPEEYILPNLKSLVWKVDTADGLERSLLFLNPQLRCLIVEIGSNVPQDEMVKFLTEVSQSTRLTTLSITSPTRVPAYLPRIMQQQTTLEDVVLLAPGCLSPSIGRWLSAMSSLTSLQVDVGDRSDGVIASFFTGLPASGVSSPGIASPDFAMSPLPGAESTVLIDFTQEQGFKQLRRVSLTGGVTSTANFLSRISAPLQSIELALDEPNDEKEWQGFWATVSKRFKHSLRSIVITASGASRFTDLIRSTSRGEYAARRLRLDALEHFPSLVRIEIELPESRVFLDEDIQRLAFACPNIEVLKLCPLSRWPLPYGAPKMTLAGLAPLASNCKRLHTLHVPLHASGTKDYSLYDMKYSSRSLERIHVGHSWIEDPLSVSILLSHLAPYMENLKWFHEKNRPGFVEAHNNGWTRVSEILPQLQRMRLHEREQAWARPSSSSSTATTTPSKATTSKAARRTAPSPPPPARTMVSKAIQARCPTVDFGSQTKIQVRHKNISTKPFQCDAEIDATPSLVDEAVEMLPAVREQAIEVQPELVSVSTETFELPGVLVTTSSQTDVEEFNEKVGFEQNGPNAASTGYVGHSAGYIAEIVRAVTPPILLKLFSFWSMLVMDGEKTHNEPMFSTI